MEDLTPFFRDPFLPTPFFPTGLDAAFQPQVRDEWRQRRVLTQLLQSLVPFGSACFAVRHSHSVEGRTINRLDDLAEPVLIYDCRPLQLGACPRMPKDAKGPHQFRARFFPSPRRGAERGSSTANTSPEVTVETGAKKKRGSAVQL